MKIRLKIWRQPKQGAKGAFKKYQIEGVLPDMSFLEMMDLLNASLIKKGEEPVAFDHDCHEGICGMCSMFINGRPHGPLRTTTCQLYMRNFKDGDSITVEPWRTKAFPVINDSVVDRSAFDRILQTGGYVSVNTGGAPDANATPVPKRIADEAFNSATCIGCGACVAACKNASAMLFVAAKATHLALMPQGQPERKERAEKMIAQMEAEGFGSCSNTGACESECPKGITLANIARLNREYIASMLLSYRVEVGGNWEEHE